MKKVLMSVLAMSALSVSINAGCTANGCYNVNVAMLYVAGNGNIYVSSDGDESTLGCTAPSGTLMTIINSHPGKNAIYSLLLTAKTTNKKVSIRTANGSANCQIEYVFMP